MNVSKLKTLLLTALGAAAIFAQEAAHANPTGQDGEVFLGFRATGGIGGDTNYVLDLGSATALEALTSPTVLSLGDVGADLSLVFGDAGSGSPWYGRNDILWSGICTVGGTSVNSYPDNSTYATRVRTNASTQTTPWLHYNPTQQAVVNNQIEQMKGGFNSTDVSSTTYFDGSSNHSLQSSKAVVQANGSPNAWLAFMASTSNGNLAFRGYSAGFEGSNASGIASTVLDLHRMTTGVNTAGTFVGTLTISNSGAITFTPASFLATPAVAFAKTTDSVAENVVGGTYTMTINRAGSPTGAASVEVSTVDGTALAGTDYTAYDQVVNFADQQTTATVTISITNRNGANPVARNFKLHFSNPTGGLSLGGDATINITPYIPPAASFASLTPSVAESAGTFTLNVVRSGDTTGTNTVNVSTVNGSAGDGTDAIAGTDYTAVSNQTITFNPGDTQKPVNVTITNRFNQAASRKFYLHFSSPSSGFTAGADSQVTITSTLLQSTVQFAAGSVAVNANGTQASVTLTINRFGGNTAESVSVTANDGTATLGTDYSAPSSSTASFPAVNGATPTSGSPQTATVTVNLLHPVGAPSRSFTVTLGSPSSHTTLGTDSTSTITIAAADLIKPTATITAPTAGQVLPTATTAGNATTVLNFSGTASDNSAVTSVNISLNGTNTSVTPSGNTWAFSTSINGATNPGKGLKGGLNKLIVTAIDAAGNISNPATVSFTFTEKGALNVALVPATGSGGKVAGKLAGNVYVVGNTYTLTATPSAGFEFDRWTIPGVTPGDALTRTATLSFVYTDAILASPTITATFIATKFSASKIGAYSGLLSPHVSTGVADPYPTTVPGNSTVGLVTLNITATGNFTGTMKYDGLSLAVSGMFDSDGTARFGSSGATSLMVSRAAAGKSSIELILSFNNLNAGSPFITGFVNQYMRTELIATSDALLEKSAFSATVPVSGANATNYLKNNGLYTFILPAKAQTNGLTTADYPQGTGNGTMTLASNGNLSFSGTLADGTAITGTAALSYRDQSKLKAPLFVQIYKNADSKTGTWSGSFGGLVTFDVSQTDSDFKAPGCWWFSPWTGKQWYPWGWDEGVNLDLLGSSYQKTLQPVFPGVTNLTTPAAQNLALDADAGDLTGPEKFFHITATNAVTKVPLATDKTYSMVLTATSGKITGTLPMADNTVPAFTAVVFQKGALGGRGFSLTTAPKVVNGTGISAPVTISPH